jgi:hypothetical protein
MTGETLACSMVSEKRSLNDFQREFAFRVNGTPVPPAVRGVPRSVRRSVVFHDEVPADERGVAGWRPVQASFAGRHDGVDLKVHRGTGRGS